MIIQSVPPTASPRFLINLKETLLVLCICYFYAIAFGLGLHRDVYGLDNAKIFVSVCGVFLFALSIQLFLSWWNRRVLFFWSCIGILFYGVIGLYVAPIFYGPSIMTYILLEPLVIIFVGGFAFAFGHVLAKGVK